MKRYEDIKKDYRWLCRTYGDPNDLTGGFVVEETYPDLLYNPTKTNAYNHIKRLIQYGFQNGTDWNVEGDFGENWGKNISISSDKELERIYNKYC